MCVCVCVYVCMCVHVCVYICLSVCVYSDACPLVSFGLFATDFYV